MDRLLTFLEKLPDKVNSFLTKFPLRARAIMLSFILTVFPSLSLVAVFSLTYLIYEYVYTSIMIDTLNLFALFSTLLLITSGIFVFLALYISGYVFFKISLNQAFLIFASPSGGLSVYKVGERYVLDTSGQIAGFQMLLGMFLFVLAVPISFLVWLIQLIRIAFSRSFAESYVQFNVSEQTKSIFGLSAYGSASLVLSMMIYGVLGVQNFIYDPFNIEANITSIQLTKWEHSSQLELIFDVSENEKIDRIIGKMVIVDENDNFEHVLHPIYFDSKSDQSILVNFYSDNEIFNQLDAIGFNYLNYYLVVDSVKFDVGTTKLSKPYTIEIGQGHYDYIERVN